MPQESGTHPQFPGDGHLQGTHGPARAVPAGRSPGRLPADDLVRDTVPEFRLCTRPGAGHPAGPGEPGLQIPFPAEKDIPS